MTLYALIGKAFDLSEESVRKIVKAEIKNKGQNWEFFTNNHSQNALPL